MKRRIVVLTEGMSNPHQGKTARNLIYYKPEEVVAVYDSTQQGKYAEELLGFGKDVPVIGSFDEVNEANTLLIGVATPGGKIPKEWKAIIMEAISRQMNVISGLHDFLSDDKELVAAAEKEGIQLIDIRKNRVKEVVHRKGINEKCLRIQTVGNDCSLGKMITSIELNRALVAAGFDSKFVATGQTGILIEGDGIPIDGVVGDFINGAAEQLVLQNQNHDIIIIEGQASLIHPRYSSVTLGLLHGSMPHGLIMCYEMGREYIHGFNDVKIPPLEDIITLYENIGSMLFPCKVIGLAINSRKYSKAEADIERDKMRERFGLPVCDVFRHGADELVSAVVSLKNELIK